MLRLKGCFWAIALTTLAEAALINLAIWVSGMYVDNWRTLIVMILFTASHALGWIGAITVSVLLDKEAAVVKTGLKFSKVRTPAEFDRSSSELTAFMEGEE